MLIERRIIFLKKHKKNTKKTQIFKKTVYTTADNSFFKKTQIFKKT